MKKNTIKQEVVVVATKYKTNPMKVDYYTKEGKAIPKSCVKKENTKYGLRFFCQS